jgi:hypothetical protein
MPSPHPTSRPEAPTGRQLRYLRALAHTRGQTFTYPRTKAQASAAIRRLKRLPAETASEREFERDRLAAVRGPRDAVAIRGHQVRGHGAHAHWTHRREERS